LVLIFIQSDQSEPSGADAKLANSTGVVTFAHGGVILRHSWPPLSVRYQASLSLSTRAYATVSLIPTN
jgi:hypothetical protein